MFEQIFGKYLVSTGKITQEQLTNVYEYVQNVRSKLGLMAVAEKLMTQEQCDEINAIQAVEDKRFGDIAVEKGYITPEQVSELLNKQNDSYMLFCQTMMDKGYLTLENIDEALTEYQIKEGFTQAEMDDLLSGDFDRTVKIFLPIDSDFHANLCGIMIRTLSRLISRTAYVEKARQTNSLKASNFVLQKLFGDRNVVAGFAGEDMSLLTIANPFAKENFTEVDMDALDAVGEFTNCVNGLFATDLSHHEIEVDMLPPEYYDHPVTVSGDFYDFPLYVNDQEVHFILAVDTELKIE